MKHRFLLAVLLLSVVPATAAQPDPPPPFEAVCFDELDLNRGYPGKDYVARLLAKVPGQSSNLGETKHGNHPIQTFSGVVKLNMPWQADSVLRFAPNDPKELQLHFWNGRNGVTLAYYPQRQRAWAAYATTRTGNRPQPETRALCALDNGRYFRTRSGSFEIRHQAGWLVMTRGDLVLLSAALPGNVREVYFEGSARIADLAMLRSGPVSSAARDAVPLETIARPVAVRVDRPADLAWQLVQEAGQDGAKLNRLPDGRVELVAAANSKKVHATATVCRPGLYEYIFQIDDAQPGTGIYLSNAQGNQSHRLGFFRHQQTGKTVIDVTSVNDSNVQRSFDPRNVQVPFAGPRQWVRMIAGAGILRCSISGDGVYWSEFRSDAVDNLGAGTTVQLICCQDRQERKITLRSIELRRLDRLSSLVPDEVLRRVGSLAAAANVDDWHQRVAESQPGDVPPALWRRACMLRTLIENVNAQVSQPVLHLLLEDVLSGPGDWDFKRRLLDEAALLTFFTNYGDYNTSPKYGAYYWRLGRQLARAGHPEPFTTVCRALMRMPGWHTQANPFDPDLLRWELLTLAQRGHWQQLDGLCRRLSYWTRFSEPNYWETPWPTGKEETIDLIRWATAQARLHTPRRPQSAPPAITVRFRHPLLEQLSKESYNVLAEFNAALQGRAYRAACQVIVASAELQSQGLLPDGRDSRLLVSLPMAVESALRANPALVRAMREHFGPIGRLRVKRAIGDGDAAAVEAVAIRFAGTEAAGEAHRWLGDRRLSQGRFAAASGAYRDSLRSIAAEQREGVEARLRLAAAMMGRDAGRPVTGSVQLGSSQFSAGQFENLVRQSREARRDPQSDAAETGGKSVFAVPPGPAPGQYDVRNWSRLDGSQDKQPGGLPRQGSDWGARVIDVTVVGNRMLVNNQVRHVGLDPGNGQQRWVQRRDLKQRQPQWSLASMRPAIDRGQIYARWLGEKGPEAACFRLDNGTPLWSVYPDAPVVSDPLVAGQDLFAMLAVEDFSKAASLELVTFDCQTGQVRSRVPLARFHDHWKGAIGCRAVLAEDRIVATVGGCVLCCEATGQVQWIRRQIWTPPAENYSHALHWLRQVHRRPLVVDGQIYATQPGVWAVECIELQTGRLRWRTPLPELIAPVGRIQQRLIVETTDGIAALDADSGRILWRHDASVTPGNRVTPGNVNRLDMRPCGREDSICYARLEEPTDQKPRRPVLVWVDPATGKTIEQSTLEITVQKNLLLGPLVVSVIPSNHGNRQWIFFASDEQPSNREIRELVPKP